MTTKNDTEFDRSTIEAVGRHLLEQGYEIYPPSSLESPLAEFIKKHHKSPGNSMHHKSASMAVNPLRDVGNATNTLLMETVFTLEVAYKEDGTLGQKRVALDAVQAWMFGLFAIGDQGYLDATLRMSEFLDWLREDGIHQEVYQDYTRVFMQSYILFQVVSFAVGFDNLPLEVAPDYGAALNILSAVDAEHRTVIANAMKQSSVVPLTAPTALLSRQLDSMKEVIEDEAKFIEQRRSSSVCDATGLVSEDTP